MGVLFIMFFAVSALLAEDVANSEEKSVTAPKSHTGTVIYSQKAGKYMYIKLDENGKEVWLATFPLKVTGGDKVEYIGGIIMKEFHSNAMNKTFDTILLITRIRVLNGTPATDKQNMPDDEYHKKSGEKKIDITMPESGDITKAVNGKTIEEIFTESEQLKGKEVTVRARVMKVSKNILNKNWITLRDGTGVSPDDKLIATTLENIQESDIVTAKGILRTDIQVGKGYNYKVLLEDAKFTE